MPQKFKFKYQMYAHLKAQSAAIFAEAKETAKEIGLTDETRGQLGLTGAVSGCHGLLSRAVEEAMNDAARKVIPSAVFDEKIREVVKEYYGDEYDAALISTCEAGLNVSYEALCMPPSLGKGDPYRARYIAPYERHFHHQGAYGRPFPPKYKEVIAERGEAAGEYGVQGKRVANLDTVVVRMQGAGYPVHGIKYNPVQDLLHTDAKKTIKAIETAAERHETMLAGFASLGYDTPGYGYSEKDRNGAPALQVGISELAQRFDVPYIVDNAWGTPFTGTDIRKNGADVMIYSMDKASGAPTCGLIIGKEEPMVLIRRALGIHGARYGTLASHGKAAYVGFDPGKEALSGALAAMKILKDQPEITMTALDGLYDICLEEFENLPKALQKGWNFYKSPNCQAVELNYSDSWKDGFGIPIFSIEDMYAGSHVLQEGMKAMGLIPTIAYDANIFISNGVGNLDEEGRLMEEPTRLAIRAMYKLIEIISRHAGLID